MASRTPFTGAKLLANSADSFINVTKASNAVRVAVRNAAVDKHKLNKFFVCLKRVVWVEYLGYILFASFLAVDVLTI